MCLFHRRKKDNLKNDKYIENLYEESHGQKTKKKLTTAEEMELMELDEMMWEDM